MWDGSRYCHLGTARIKLSPGLRTPVAALFIRQGIALFAPGSVAPVQAHCRASRQRGPAEMAAAFDPGSSSACCSSTPKWWAWPGGWFWGPRFLLYASIPASVALRDPLSDEDASPAAKSARRSRCSAGPSGCGINGAAARTVGHGNLQCQANIEPLCWCLSRVQRALQAVHRVQDAECPRSTTLMSDSGIRSAQCSQHRLHHDSLRIGGARVPVAEAVAHRASSSRFGVRRSRHGAGVRRDSQTPDTAARSPPPPPRRPHRSICLRASAPPTRACTA